MCQTKELPLMLIGNRCEQTLNTVTNNNNSLDWIRLYDSRTLGHYMLDHIKTFPAEHKTSLGHYKLMLDHTRSFPYYIAVDAFCRPVAICKKCALVTVILWRRHKARSAARGCPNLRQVEIEGVRTTGHGYFGKARKNKGNNTGIKLDQTDDQLISNGFLSHQTPATPQSTGCRLHAATRA